MHGEQRLARALIARCLSDAGIESGERVTITCAVQDEARNFLTANSGSWKAARTYWASMADVDPEKLRIRTMELLGIEQPPSNDAVSQPASNEPLRLFYPVPKPEKPKRLPKPKPAPKPARQPKRQQVLDMLLRPEGVSLDEIAERFGWKRDTARNCVKYDVRSYGFEGLVCRDGRYRAFLLPETSKPLPQKQVTGCPPSARSMAQRAG